MINFVYHTDFIIQQEEPIFLWLSTVFVEEKKVLKRLQYVFCSDEKLLEINKEFLSHNNYTDIITFDYSEANKITGEIFISAQRVLENSKTFKSSFENELRRVLVHGVLHLCGYKDKYDKEKKVMTKKENYYLSKI